MTCFIFKGTEHPMVKTFHTIFDMVDENVHVVFGQPGHSECFNLQTLFSKLTSIANYMQISLLINGLLKHVE